MRHCARCRKVAGSNHDGVIGIFHLHNPSGRTLPLGLTQPLTKTSTRNIFFGKGGRCVGLTNVPISYADCLEIWVPQPPVILRACPGQYRDCFIFTFTPQEYTICPDGLYNGFVQFIHLAVCLTTGPKPLPTPALHIVRSRASSFK